MPTIVATVDPTGFRAGTAATMMALVYGGPGKRAWQSMPKAVVRDPGDAVIRITTSTICGTDLHILKGDLPSVTPGRILAARRHRRGRSRRPAGVGVPRG